MYTGMYKYAYIWSNIKTHPKIHIISSSHEKLHVWDFILISKDECNMVLFMLSS